MKKIESNKKRYLLLAIFSVIVFVIVNISLWSIAKADNDNSGNAPNSYSTIHLHKAPLSSNFNFLYNEPKKNSFVYTNYDINKIDDENIDIKVYDKIIAINLTDEHIDSGCVNKEGHISLNKVCFSYHPNSLVYVLLSDGSVATTSYIKDQIAEHKDVDLYITVKSPNYFNIKETTISDSRKGYIKLDKSNNIKPGSVVNFEFVPSEDGYLAVFEITDYMQQKINIQYNGNNKYSFVMPYSDVKIAGKTHHIKEFHRKISQTFTSVGLRAYYITDDGLYFRANDEYTTFNDNSIGTLIGDVDDFNVWKNVFCFEHTAADGTHYEKGWGGKIEPDM